MPWKLLNLHEMLFFPSNMEQTWCFGGFGKMDGFKAGSNSTVIYFHSEDCTTEQNRVETAGGKVVQPKMSIGEYGFISLCIDTEGNMFGLHSTEMIKIKVLLCILTFINLSVVRESFYTKKV
ncbi:MAG: hypothetical protein R2821_06000 [Flavobacteriaceae bacterium]